MAKGGRITMSLDTRKFEKQLRAAITHVERGTRRATVAACEDIKARSLVQVPRDSGTLADSFFYEVKGYRSGFTAEIGYGRSGSVNPKTGRTASAYMTEVHEDLTVPHSNGKAKFLEDPLREYQRDFGARAAQFIRQELG